MCKDTLFVSWHGINRKSCGKRSLVAAAMHNCRELPNPGENIDPTRSHLNRSLLSLPNESGEIVRTATDQLRARNYTPKRHDATIAVEGVFSLRETPSTFDMFAYFEECARWLETEFDGQLLSAHVHRDEDRPHCHAIVLLPVTTDGPSGTEMIGKGWKEQARAKRFFHEVANRYGLSMPAPLLSKREKAHLARAVHAALEESNDPVLRSRAWPWISRCISRDPSRIAHDLGITGCTEVNGHGAQTDSDDGHGEQHDSTNISVATKFGSDASGPVPASGDAGDPAADTHPVYRLPQYSAPTPKDDGALHRDRDSDHPSASWDSEAGEFRSGPTSKQPSARMAAEAAVAAMLAARQSQVSAGIC